MSLEDKLEQYEKDLVIANDMVTKLLEVGRKLKEEKKQAETPKFGEILAVQHNKNRERFVLYDANGVLRVYYNNDGRLLATYDDPLGSCYTRTGRNIAEFLKTS